jgi:aldehyde dehydrogenase (NAD+)
VAPDYILCHKDVEDALVASLGHYITRYFGKRPLKNKQYPHMINQHHFERVCGLIDNINSQAKVAFGGGRDAKTLKIEPTILTGVNLQDPVMGQEIFGPVLPILTYDTLEDALDVPAQFGHPLACYIFSNDKQEQRRIIDTLPYGGGCVNDVVIHVATNHMPFGGLGNSGMGHYHGRTGFDTFTHYKSVLTKYNFYEPNIRNAPYNPIKFGIIKALLH